MARDAREFGAYARTGGWAFALKVARSVRPGGQAADETDKVSAKRFAELAGCSPERVMRYYKAWDMAADDGLVPKFEALALGEDVELPDADAWSGLRAAILADPDTARAARSALLDRIKEDPALQTELARDLARDDELKKAVAGEARTAERIGFVRQVAEGGQVRTPAGQSIDAPAGLRAEAERHLSLIDELDDEAAGQWAGEACESVKALVAETVEADPELRVRERRTKFYSSLQKATKVFEELTFDDADADDLYEDDMVQRLEALQHALAACITALRRAAPPTGQ